MRVHKHHHARDMALGFVWLVIHMTEHHHETHRMKKDK